MPWDPVADMGGNVWVHDVRVDARLDLREGPSLDLGRCAGPPRLIKNHPAEELDPLVSFGGEGALVLMRPHGDNLRESGPLATRLRCIN